MVKLIVIALTLVGCGGCEPPPPCANGTCFMDASGPAGWQDAARATWACFGDASAPAPPLDVVRWVARGDCAGGMVTSIGCMEGATGIATSPVAAPDVTYIYALDDAIKDGSFNHELLHAWLALTRRQDNGDPTHHRPEWIDFRDACDVVTRW